MDYRLEIKAFYDYIESNPQMTETCICLWHALMYQANKTGWKSEFSVAISTLKLRTSLSKDAIYRARNKLKQFGLIEFKERTGNQSAVYRVNSLLVSFIQTQDATQGATQTTPQDATQPANITIQDKTRQNILSSELNSDGEKASEKKGKKTPGRRKAVYPPESKYYKIARWLASDIEKSVPGHKPHSEATLQTWADEARLMIETDKRDGRMASKLLEFARTDSFWKNNVLSITKFRKQYDLLLIKYQEKNGGETG